MSSSTIAETKNNLSAILATLSDGSEREHVIRNRDVPIAIIVPYAAESETPRRIGIAKGDGFDIDWDAFDAMDDEIAEMFGLS